MAKYRKRPIVIDAWQFDGTIPYIPGLVLHATPYGVVIIETLEGEMVVSNGDWIIRGVAGEFYSCKPAIFEATYEKV